jgi:hypothetical protein
MMIVAALLVFDPTSFYRTPSWKVNWTAEVVGVYLSGGDRSVVANVKKRVLFGSLLLEGEREPVWGPKRNISAEMAALGRPQSEAKTSFYGYTLDLNATTPLFFETDEKWTEPLRPRISQVYAVAGKGKMLYPEKETAYFDFDAAKAEWHLYLPIASQRAGSGVVIESAISRPNSDGDEELGSPTISTIPFASFARVKAKKDTDLTFWTGKLPETAKRFTVEDDREVRFYGPVGLPPVTVSMKVSLEFIPTPP